MYHDQVLAPFKTIFKFDAININIRLKIFKTFSRSWCCKKYYKENKLANHTSLIKMYRIFKKI